MRDAITPSGPVLSPLAWLLRVPKALRLVPSAESAGITRSNRHANGSAPQSVVCDSITVCRSPRSGGLNLRPTKQVAYRRLIFSRNSLAVVAVGSFAARPERLVLVVLYHQALSQAWHSPRLDIAWRLEPGKRCARTGQSLATQQPDAARRFLDRATSTRHH